MAGMQTIEWLSAGDNNYWLHSAYEFQQFMAMLRNNKVVVRY